MIEKNTGIRFQARLDGPEGNAFFLLAKAVKLLRDAAFEKEKINSFLSEATSGDYDHLIETLKKTFRFENALCEELY